MGRFNPNHPASYWQEAARVLRDRVERITAGRNFDSANIKPDVSFKSKDGFYTVGNQPQTLNVLQAYTERLPTDLDTPESRAALDSLTRKD